MCDSVIRDLRDRPIAIPWRKHKFIYVDHGGARHVLIDAFEMEGRIDYASVTRIENERGVKAGYLFVVGEQM